jgi:hypothetical protein
MLVLPQAILSPTGAFRLMENQFYFNEFTINEKLIAKVSLS